MANSPSLDQLKKATAIAEKIDALKAELEAILSGGVVKAKRGRKPNAEKAAGDDSEKPAKTKVKRVMSPEAREKIAAAQRRRWSKTKRASKKAAAEA